MSGYSGAGAKETVTYSNSFTTGNVIKKTSGGWALAQADSAANAEVVGVVQSATGADFTVIYSGPITGFTGLVDSQVYFLSDTVAGSAVSVEPTTAGSISKPVMIATSSTTANVEIMRGFLIGNSGVFPAWTNAGAITLSATTTGPTKGTTTSDNISYRQLGAKEWEVIITYIQTATTGGASGTGDYLITLPNGLSFDTTLPSQQIITTNVGTNTYALMIYIIPSGSGLITNSTIGGQVYPLVYSATKFRVLTTTYGNAIQCWGSGYYSVGDDNPKIQLTFRFTST